MSRAKRSFILTVVSLMLLGIIISLVLVLLQNRRANAPKTKDSQATMPKSVIEKEPQIKTEIQLSGLSHPWDMAFLPNSKILFNERSGAISTLENGSKRVIKNIEDNYAVGEGGLTGMTLDQDFANSPYLYTCHNAKTAGGIDVRVSRWRLDQNSLALSERQDIVTGIPSNSSGRHSGCRIKADKKGDLWISTGDAAMASTPQDPQSLGGKILRVTKDGKPVAGNQSAPFDPRIFSYGHRNTQGLVLFDEPRGDVYGYSVEHGSDIDDEINLLKTGNFGWSPRSPYIESGVAMTDKTRYPDAVDAIWVSGRPTIAPSGAAILKGEKWGTWQGSVAMAVLKNKHVRIIQFDENYKITLEKEVLGDFGRIRSANLDANGDLYLTTDNGSDDKIIKVTPSQ